MQKFAVTTIASLLFMSRTHALLAPEKAEKIKAELHAIETAGGDRLGYAEAMLDYLRGGHRGENSRFHERPQVNPFDLFSGSLAIRESLQLTTITSSKGEKPTVNISTLKGPQVRSHNFAQMLKGRQSKAFPLAENAPPDWFYAHFSSLTRALDFGDYLNQTGGAFYNRFSEAPLDSSLKKRLLTQLALKENKEARIFYDSVIQEMALVSSDFFFGMGTDVSALFKIKQKGIFETTIKTYRDQFLKEIQGATSEQLRIEGRTVNFISSPDRRLRSYLYIQGDFAIISNSAVALARLLRIAVKKEPALASLDEFKYMRSVYLADTASEDGFIYFSDAFIRRLVSPEVRIAEARRMETAFKLAQLEKIILLHQHAYGKTAKDLDSLIESIAIDADHAKKMRELFADFSVNEFRARHAEFGTLGNLKPNLESGITKITAAESDGYRRFVENYSNFWREYFDPIGIRFQKKASGIKIEICILPLIENSIYNQVTAFLGGKPTPHLLQFIPNETFSVAAKINAEMLKTFRIHDEDKDFLRGFAGNIQLHALDNYPTVDFNPDFLFDEFSRGRARPDALIGVVAWSLFHPLRLSVEMRDNPSALGLIQAVRGLSQYSSRWQSHDAYDYVYKDKKITVFVLNIARIIAFRFHAYVDGNMIHVASTREYIEKFIDAEKLSRSEKGNLIAIHRPAQILHEKPHIVQGNAEKVQKSCLAHMGTIKLAALIFPGEDAPAAIEKRYGFKPVCPAGGAYSIKNGHPTHSIFGTRAISRMDLKIIEELFADYFATEEFRLNFEFTPYGIMTTIETK